MDIIGKFKDWRSYRRTVNELGALSNRELDDLGITRADIDRCRRHGNWLDAVLVVDLVGERDRSGR